LGTGFTVTGSNLEMQYEESPPPIDNHITYHYIPGYTFVGFESVEWIRLTLANEDEVEFFGNRPILLPDTDSDEIPDDGDISGVAGDNYCTGGNTAGCYDNCPLEGNSAQLDNDSDGAGDVCDDDNDGHNDATESANGTDPLDPDSDSDGVCDGPALATGCSVSGPDNCPFMTNADQADSDGDGIGNACEASVPAIPTLGLLALGTLILGTGTRLLTRQASTIE
jgi:hypothetical protein